jgi:DNA-binding CsgD family transcriptional regulator
MDTAAEVTGSVGAVLLPVRGRVPGVPVSPSVAEMISTYFREGWSSRDERYRGVPTMLQRGVMSDLDFVGSDEVETSSYYQDFLGRFGLRWFGGIKIAAGEDLWCLAIQRSVEQGPFSDRELQKLGALSGNLSSSAAMARALGAARAEAILEAFDLSGSAVVLLDRCGEVTYVNRAAQRIFGCDLRIFRRRIVSVNSPATTTLDRTLHALIWRVDEIPPQGPVILPRAEGRPILAYPCRIPSVGLDFFAPWRLAIVFVDLECRVSLVEGDLIRAFSLTPAEARLASRLISGDSIEHVAAKLGIAYETARNVLKRVFHKTGTHRQGELIAVLAQFTRRN